MIFQIETGLEMSVLGDIDLSCDLSDVHVVMSWTFINQIMNFFLVSPYGKGMFLGVCFFIH